MGKPARRAGGGAPGRKGAALAEIITADLCVIGAGIGGLTAAAEARALGASVVLIERDKLGGDYLNTGTVPSKALAAAAAHAHAMRTGGPFGIAGDEPRVNTRKVHDGIEQIIAAIAPNDAVARVEALGVQVVKATAKFLDPRTVEAGETHVRARRFIVATGARSSVPPINGLDAVPFFTTETIFDNTRKLTHLAVIGGGPLGLELAQSYGRLGTAVTLIESGTLLAGYDPELAAIALGRMREEGVDLRPGAHVESIQARSQGIGVIIRSGEQDQMLDVSHILVANRRVPNLDALDLAKAGIRHDPANSDHLQLTAALRTSNNCVYAIGDAAGGTQRAHLAAYQAKLAVRSALLGLPVKADAADVPSVVFTDPEIAEVGLNEVAARQKQGENFRVLRASFADNDRARASRQTWGAAKVIVGRDGRLLGAGITGTGAGELIGLFAFAIANRMNARQLADFAAPHATLSEIVTRLGREYSGPAAVSPLMQRLVGLVRHLP